MTYCKLQIFLCYNIMLHMFCVELGSMLMTFDEKMTVFCKVMAKTSGILSIKPHDQDKVCLRTVWVARTAPSCATVSGGASWFWKQRSGSWEHRWSSWYVPNILKKTKTNHKFWHMIPEVFFLSDMFLFFEKLHTNDFWKQMIPEDIVFRCQLYAKSLNG